MKTKKLYVHTEACPGFFHLGGAKIFSSGAETYYFEIHQGQKHTVLNFIRGILRGEYMTLPPMFLFIRGICPFCPMA
jgi:hypothetical protein